MKNLKHTLINISHLNLDLISKICTNLDIKSIKTLCRSSLYISKYLNKDLLFWQLYCKIKYNSINECKESVKKKYILLKNIKTGKNETSITFHTNQKDITSMIIINNSIYTSSDDSTVKQFNLSGVLINSFVGHKGGVWSFSVDKCVVTGSTDKTAIIWDIKTSLPLHKLKGHTSTVRVVKNYGDYICTGGRDCVIRIWNLIGECLYILNGHKMSVRCLDINSSFLLSGSYDGSVILWDYKKGKKIFNLTSHKARVYCVLLGTKYIVSSGLDAYIHVSTFDNTLICKYKEHDMLVIGLTFSHNERYLVSTAADEVLCKWDILENRKIYNTKEKSFISSHFIYEDLLFITTQNRLKVYDYNTGLFIRNMMEADKFIKVEMYNNNLIVGYIVNNKIHIKIYKYI